MNKKTIMLDLEKETHITLKKGITVIVDNPNTTNDSPDPTKANQGKSIINRIGLYIKQINHNQHSIMVGRKLVNLHSFEFSPFNHL